LALWRAATALELLLLIRVLSSFRRLKWFALALLLSVCLDIVLMCLPAATNAYAYTWAIGGELVIAAQSAAALEAFENMLRDYPGLGRAGAALLGVALLAASLLAAASLGADISAIHTAGFWLSLVIAARHAWSMVLAVFVLLASIMFRVFPLPRRPNDLRHLAIITALFLAYAGTFWWQNFDRRHLDLSNVAYEGLRASCFAVWLIALRRAGEVRPRSDIAPMTAEEFRKWNDDVRALRATWRR
jgi:hypothetical protein